MRGLSQQFAPQHRLRKQTLQQRLLDSVRDGSLKARLSRTKLAAIATFAGEAMTIRCITHVLCPLQRANSKMALGAALTEAWPISREAGTSKMRKGLRGKAITRPTGASKAQPISSSSSN
ncbi:hypothetical protein AAE026_12910 [Bradyrhizobium sp. DN5]|uniref:hypothetical protein n=1 Tax=Bradyrhizobium sp. DN5 TaxID=3056950 RepID=UPI00352474DE